MKNLPTTRQLQYLLALAREQHFGRAAESCFVSQSAFSIAIRELESTLECQLFERSNRSVQITQAGEEVVKRTQDIITRLEDLSEIARSQQNPLSSAVNLAVIPTIAPFLLPRVLPKLQRHFTELELILSELQTADAYTALRAGEVDLILIALPYELPGTTVMPLFDDAFHLAFRHNSKWLNDEQSKKKTFSGRLPDEAVILLKDGHCLRDHALSECRLQGSRQQSQISRYESTSITTLLHMVAQDLGVTYIPEMALASPLMKGLKLDTRPMPPGSHRGIGLAWRENSPFDAAYRELGEAMINIYPGHGKPA